MFVCFCYLSPSNCVDHPVMASSAWGQKYGVKLSIKHVEKMLTHADPYFTEILIEYFFYCCWSSYNMLYTVF